MTSVFLRQEREKNRARDGPSVCVSAWVCACLGEAREAATEKQGWDGVRVNPTLLKLGPELHPRDARRSCH